MPPILSIHPAAIQPVTRRQKIGEAQAEVGWPPILGVCHQDMQVLDHRTEVKTFKRLGIVEPVAHGFTQSGVPVKNRDAQGVRPPLAIPAPARRALPGTPRRLLQVDHCWRQPPLSLLFFFDPSFELEILSGKRAGARICRIAPGK